MPNSSSTSKFKHVHALLQAMPKQQRSQLLGQLKGVDPNFTPTIKSNTSHQQEVHEEAAPPPEPIPEFHCLQNLSPAMIQKVFHGEVVHRKNLRCHLIIFHINQLNEKIAMNLNRIR